MVAVLLLFTATVVNAIDVNVPAGNSDEIQVAINSVAAAGGGTVQLAAGTYVLNSSIKMKSNVTLQGAGTATRLELPLDATYAMIVDDGTEPCINMTIRNMLLDGNIPESKVSHDPDYNDPQGNSLGIFFDAYKEATYHQNVILENLEIHNTVDACHLKGVKGGYWDNVYFHHNGIFYWPGHNSYLRRVIDYTVKNSRFEDSYNGSGINCSWSKNLLFSNCEVIRSEGRGIRNAASEGFVVHDCIILDCGSEGIIANAESGITTSKCDFKRNCISGCGTGMSGGASGVAYDNKVFNNGKNISLGSGIVQKNNTTASSQSCLDGIGEWDPISVTAHVNSENSKQVILKVSDYIAGNDSIEGFTVKANERLLAIDSITLIDQSYLLISLANEVAADDEVALSYTSGNLQTELGVPINDFYDLRVYNLGLPIEIENAGIDASGVYANFEFNNEIGTIHDQSENFTFIINGKSVETVNTIVGDTAIQVYPARKIYMGDVVEMSYMPGDYARIIASNTSELEAFSNVLLENSSTLILPVLPGKVEAESYDSQNGTQLEDCSEGGQNLAYIHTDDWAEYNIRVLKDTTYKATFRVASRYDGGVITVYVDGSTKGIVMVPNTGVWQQYQSTSVDMKLTSGEHTIKLIFTESFNFNWMQFEETVPGNEGVFFDRIEAEDYNDNSGTSIETCSDTDGGENVGSIRNGNWLKFSDLDLSKVGGIEMRLAHKTTGSTVEIRLDSATGTLIGTVPIPNTGGYQTWQTVSGNLTAEDGTHDVYLVFKNSGSWAGNINWFQFVPLNSSVAMPDIEANKKNQTLLLFPNPTVDHLNFENNTNAQVEIFSNSGRKVSVTNIPGDSHSISTSGLLPGIYFIRLSDGICVKSNHFIKY